MEPSQAPRRSAIRYRTMVKAKIFHGAHLHELNCTLTDRSDAGARVRLPAGMFIPDVVWLLDIRAGLVSQARVAWRNYPVVGLAFLETSPAERDDTPERRIFNRAWLAAKA
jgi:hypothetical protein